MSKREEQKNRYRNQIIAAAKEIFLKEGFHKATTKKISKLAGVGEGTIYNHFRTKSDILICIYKDLVYGDEKNDYVYESKKFNSAFEYIVDFFDFYWQSTKKINKEWLRELFSTAYKSASIDNIYSKFIDIDKVWIDRLQALLIDLKKDKLIKDSIELERLLSILYSLIMQNYSEYAIFNEMSYDYFRNELISDLEFLFDNILV
ncbi:MAG: TetR/AcrR family transcriptional regulator [Clostridia bacterium]|nr:TetR/AcrR family transcriptional regulator [Clostridia bacterium]